MTEPFYEYACMDCYEIFAAAEPPNEGPECPFCWSERLEILFTPQLADLTDGFEALDLLDGV